MYYSTASNANKKHPANKITLTDAIENKRASATAAKAPEKKETKQIFPDAVNTVEKRSPEKTHPGADIEHTNENTGAFIKNTRRKDGVQDRSVMDATNTIYGNGAEKNAAGTMPKNTDHTSNTPQLQNMLVEDGKRTGNNLPSGKSTAENIPPVYNRSLKIENNESGHSITADSITIPIAPVTGSVTTDNTGIALKSDLADSIRPLTKPAATKNNLSLKETNKMEWGISVQAGVSGILNEMLGVSSALPSSYNSNPAGNFNNLATGPSAVKPGAAFAAGIIAHKTLGKNYRLLTALHYSYVSTRMETGTKIDSNGAAVQYHTGNAAVYTNRFYFIELPVTIQKQLGMASHFSVDAGIAVSLLSRSNALQYDQLKDIYYIDNSRINKLQLGVLAGLNYRLLQKSFSVETGPQFNYCLTNIFEKQLYGSRHLFFAGISTKIFFRKNKR
jgi:Outer membrane protein beta-barrel domain